MGRFKNYMVDQFGEPLQVGQCYGVHLTGDQTRAKVWFVRELLRGQLTLAEVDPSQFRGYSLPVFTGQVQRHTNLTVGLLQFVRLDREYREVEQLAQPAKEERARNMRQGLRKIAKEAQVLRDKQRRLIQEVAVALEGVSEDPTDVGDMAAAFIRDDDSHVKIEIIMALYVDSLNRSERGE